MKKFDIGFAFSDAFNTIKRGGRSYLIMALVFMGINLIFALMVTTNTLAEMNTLQSSSQNILEAQEIARNISLITGLFLIALAFVQSMILKITDDLIENRDHNFGGQVSFVLKRFLRILITNILAFIPAILLGFISVLILLSFANYLIFFLLFLALIAYIFLISLVNQAIIIDSCKVFQALNKSFDTIRASFFRYAFTMIGFGIVNMIIGKFLESDRIIFIILSNLFAGLISLFICVFQTTLYKQINTSKQDIEMLKQEL